MSDYELARKAEKWPFVRVADRNTDTLFPSMRASVSSARQLLNSLEIEFLQNEENGKTPDIKSLEWKSVRTTENLLMEEISYLSTRIDQLNNASATVKSIFIAILALVVSTIISLAGLWNEKHCPDKSSGSSAEGTTDKGSGCDFSP